MCTVACDPLWPGHFFLDRREKPSAEEVLSIRIKVIKLRLLLADWMSRRNRGRESPRPSPEAESVFSFCQLWLLHAYKESTRREKLLREFKHVNTQEGQKTGQS